MQSRQAAELVHAAQWSRDRATATSCAARQEILARLFACELSDLNAVIANIYSTLEREKQ